MITSSDSSTTIKYFDEVHRKLTKLSIQTDSAMQLHKFKQLFRDKYSIIVRTNEIASTQAGDNHKTELDKLKDLLRNYFARNESMKTRSTSQINVDATNFEKQKRNIFCKICKKYGTHTTNKKRFKTKNHLTKPIKIQTLIKTKNITGGNAIIVVK